MNIDFSQQQLELLTDILSEYTQDCYESMMDASHVAADAEEEFIRKEYAALARGEEGRFNETRALADYIQKYAELMKGRNG